MLMTPGVVLKILTNKNQSMVFRSEIRVSPILIGSFFVFWSYVFFSVELNIESISRFNSNLILLALIISLVTIKFFLLIKCFEKKTSVLFNEALPDESK